MFGSGQELICLNRDFLSLPYELKVKREIFVYNLRDSLKDSTPRVAKILRTDSKWSEGGRQIFIAGVSSSKGEITLE